MPADINVISPENSFVGNLGPSASFLGAFIDVTDYTTITFTAAGLVPPAALGLQFEWSQDKISVHSTTLFGNDLSNQQSVHSVVRARFFRVRYTAGPVGQTDANLQTLLRKGTIAGSVSEVGLITGIPDAQIINGVMFAQTPAGKFVPLHLDSNDNLKVALIGGTIAVTGQVDVSGSVIALDAPTLAALETINVLGPLTDSQLRATPVPISGTVSVSGPLTDAQLRATPVSVSGTDPTGTLTNGAQVSTAGAGSIAILASNVNRRRALIQNVGTVTCRIGVSGVTVTTGIRLQPGDSMTFEQPYCPTQQLFMIREGLVDSTVFAIQVTT